MQILLVEDHELMRRGLKDTLAEAYPEARFGEAADSATALQQVMAQPWQLVLLDINIPGRNGLEILTEIKRLQPDTPVLVLSAYPEEEFAVRAFKLGAAGYLTKAGAADELLVAVGKVLAGGKYVTAGLAEKLATALGAPGQQSTHEALSARELQVLQLIASGKTIKEAAAELSLSEKTVGTYRARISNKLGLATNVELTRYALRHRLVE